MVLKLGINEWPMPGRLVRKCRLIEAEYHALTKTDGAPFFPYAIWKDMFFAAYVLLAVAACAWYFGPFGPSGNLIRRSFRLPRGRIISSCGCTRCCRCFRRRWKLRLC